MSDINAPAEGGQGAADTAAPAAGASQAPAGFTPPTWLPSADEVTAGYVANKGWTEPGQVLDGYRNLEKLLGADRAGRTVVLPKDDAGVDELNAFYGKLGRPASADDYKLSVPEGGNPDFAKAAAAEMHRLGLTTKQAQALVEWNNGQFKANAEAERAAAQARFADDDRALKAEWGNAYTQSLNQAQAAARGLGMTNEMIDQLAQGLGHKATMQLFQKIGAKMGEDSFVTGDKLEKFGNALTPGQAKAEIESLKSDKEFQQKYFAGNSEAKARMARLMAFAYPEDKS